jgi:hypothetical protein
MAAYGNGQHIVGAHHMAGLGDLGPVEAHMARLDQFRGRGPLFHHPGKPEPFVQALCQFFLPIICALRVSRMAKGELGSMGFSGRRLGSSRRSGRSLA